MGVVGLGDRHDLSSDDLYSGGPGRDARLAGSRDRHEAEADRQPDSEAASPKPGDQP